MSYWLSFQFIQQAIRRDFTNVEEILMPPEGQDEGVWKYEHLRLINLLPHVCCSSTTATAVTTTSTIVLLKMNRIK